MHCIHQGPFISPTSLGKVREKGKKEKKRKEKVKFWSYEKKSKELQLELEKNYTSWNLNKYVIGFRNMITILLPCLLIYKSSLLENI